MNNAEDTLTQEDIDALSNPVWYSITGEQTQLGSQTATAASYDDEVSIFAAVADIDLGPNPLLELVQPGNIAALISTDSLMLTPHWRLLSEVPVFQMICTDPSPCLPLDVTELGAHHAPDMLALAQLTEPGPFAIRTVEMGDYIGIYEHGKLMAMAGERFKSRNWIEVSGVCTHPDGRGRGYAQALVAMLQERIHARGQNSFLHVVKTSPSMKTATGVYERVGFRYFQTVYVSVLRRHH